MGRPAVDLWKSAHNGRAVSAKESMLSSECANEEGCTICAESAGPPEIPSRAGTPLQAVQAGALRRAKSLGTLMRRAETPKQPAAPAEAPVDPSSILMPDSPPVGVVLRHHHVLRHGGPSTIRLVEPREDPDTTLTGHVPYLPRATSGTPSELLRPKKKLPPIPAARIDSDAKTRPPRDMPGTFPTSSVYRSTRRSRSQADLLSSTEVDWMGHDSLPRNFAKRRSSLGPAAGLDRGAVGDGDMLRSRVDALNAQSL